MLILAQSQWAIVRQSAQAINCDPAISRLVESAQGAEACRLRVTRGRLAPVDKYEELRLRILQGKSDANINFDELCHLLRCLGFQERTRGSHHIFMRPGVRELINLQREGSKAKVYQVRQTRQVLVRYGLEGEKE